MLWKAARYSVVSAGGIVLTQVLLLLGHGPLGIPAGRANVAAVLLASVPVFSLNRAWVWQLQGRSSLRREVLPFWGFTVAGLLLSTLAVAAVSAVTASTVAVSAANVGAFGLLWVVKFAVLDGVVFAAPGADAGAPAPAVPVGTA